jgi:phosphatidylinositol-3-phosphatase
MKRLAVPCLVALSLLAALTGLSAPAASASGQTACNATTGTQITHVVWVVFENRSIGEVQGHAPYLDTLAADCGLATNYHNITHPSLPNYIAMTSGTPLASLPTTDCPTFCPQSAPSIFAQSPSWGVYAESMPSNCLTSDQRPYVVHHTAAPYYTSLTNCDTNDVPLTAMNTAALPAFSLIIPDVTHDMHPGSSSVAAGDTWLASFLPNILNRAEYQAGSVAVFITWDEGGLPRHASNCGNNTTDIGCQVALYVLAKVVTPGTTSTELLNHYGLLRTTEEILGYPLLGDAADANSMLSAFGL